MTALRVRVALTAAVLLAGAAASEGATCSVSATGLVFGAYNVFFTAPTDSTATVVLSCRGNAANVQVSITRGSSPTFARRMANGPELLFYNLYRDAARTAVWGDGSSGTQVHVEPMVANNRDVTLTIFGRTPQEQDVAAGSYADSVTVIVNY